MNASAKCARSLSTVAVFVLLSGACGGDDDDAASPTAGAGSTTTTETSGTATSTSQPDGSVTVDIYLIDQEAFNVGTAPYEVALERQVPPDDPMKGALDALFEGPTTDEANRGIIHVGSGATGVSKVTVDNGVARVYLEGACSSGGSTLTVAAEIFPTVMQFDGVDAVKIYDPEGTTEEPDGTGDSIPECLEP